MFQNFSLNKTAGVGAVLLFIALGVYVAFEVSTGWFTPDALAPAPESFSDPATLDEVVETSVSSPEISPENPTPATTVQTSIPVQTIFSDVPFTAQAPRGDWSDPRQQHGCEEASLVMAHYWILGRNLTPSQALKEINELSAYEVKLRGHSHDTSAADTLALWREYYHHEGAYLLENLQSDEQPLKEVLARGGLVIAPTDGLKLHNPNFTPPGPDRHMLVIIGYDDRRGVFITNDPGTRRGRNYVYSYQTLMNALRDYPTGEEVPIVGAPVKNAIAVFR